ncbi:ATP-binding protein [Candidatus Woesearchaeota archaeon]|nr:ATP-binding protein [Candidatus Woesearchaeota archaeon]
MSQTELWYNRLGFYNNPFSIKPAAFHSEIIGYDLEDVFGKVESGGVLYISGPMGIGKTTILKNIIARFGGKGRVIYTSCNTSDKKTDFRKLLVNTSFFGRLFSSPSKNMILLVDEAQDIKKQESNDILRFFRKGNFKSIVFFGTEVPGEKLGDGINELVKDNVKFLSKLKPESAVDLVRKRIGSLDFISDSMIKKIYRLSGSNPRKLLENCEDIFKVAADRKASRITDEHLMAVIKVKKEKKRVAAPRIFVEEISDEDLHFEVPKRQGKSGNDYGVRTYEEEMDTLKSSVKEQL